MKTAYLPLPVEWHPLPFDSSWVDFFRFPISAQAGLPPPSQACILRVLLNRLTHLSDRFFLWVELDTPGTWYTQELYRLTRRSDNLVITPPGVKPKPDEVLGNKYFFYSPPEENNLNFPICRPPAPLDLHPSVLLVLRTLARLEQAQTLEIASLSGFSNRYTLVLLHKLEHLGYACRAKVWKYPGWILTHSGLLQAHRSWNLPPRTAFRSYRQEHTRGGPRHRRVSRLWRAWLEKSYQSAVEIWGCWTEFGMQPGFPDALAWGTWRGRECLFWLEVDTGHISRKKLRRLYTTRYHRVPPTFQEVGIPTVFALLSMPWVIQAVVPIFNNIDKSMAVIVEDWRRFGTLPIPQFGRCQLDLKLMETRGYNRDNFPPRQDWTSKFNNMGKR